MEISTVIGRGRSRGLSVMLLLALLSIPALVSAQAEDGVAQARALALKNQRADAVAMLRRILAAAPEDGDALVLLGTVLAWNGEYGESRSLLERALAAHPGDTDALSALMNVELWSGRPRQALDLARRGLDRAPNDDRFLQGRARARQAIASARPWSVWVTRNDDWFSDRRPAWHETQASLKRETPAGPVIVSGSHAARFGTADNQIELEMYPRFRPGTYAYVSGAWAPDGRLYPDYRLAADLYQSLGAGFEGSAGFRRLGFGRIANVYVGTLNKYIGDWLLTGRAFYMPNEAGATSRAFHGSVRRYFGPDGASFVGARYGHGSAREEIRDVHDVDVLGSDTVAAETRVAVTRRLVINATGATSRQDRRALGILRQNSISASAGIRF